MKKLVSLLLAAAMCLSLAGCGGAAAKKPCLVESKGLFLLEPGDSLDLSEESGLSEQQAYLIHVYDLMPDEKQNASVPSNNSLYTIKLNGSNEYESLRTYESDRQSLNSFFLTCGYANPTKLGEILAGGDPIRAMSVFRVNKNDLKDGETTAVFSIQGSDVYDCELSLTQADIQTIPLFDEVLRLEDDYTARQAAGSLYARAKTFKSLTTYYDMWVKNPDNYDISLVMSLLPTTMTLGMSCGLDGGGNQVLDTSLPAFDAEAAKRGCPDLAGGIDTLASIGDEWMDAMKVFSEAGTMETFNEIDRVKTQAASAADEIISYFEARK